MLDPDLCPEKVVAGLRRYLEHHTSPGYFLESVLANDLMESFALADSTNGPVLGAICAWVYHNVPRSARGSREAVAYWLALPPVDVRGQPQEATE